MNLTSIERREKIASHDWRARQVVGCGKDKQSVGQLGVGTERGSDTDKVSDVRARAHLCRLLARGQSSSASDYN